MAEPPIFRFFPTAYKKKVFSEEFGECDCCNKNTKWFYQGSIYTRMSPKPSLCAQCIANDSVIDFLPNGWLGFHDMDFSELPAEEFLNEVRYRTPGFAVFNPFIWPVIDGQPLAFIGYGEEKELWDLPGARSAVKKEWLSVIGEELEFGGETLLVFKTLDNRAYQAVIDLY